MPLNKSKGNMYGFVTHTWNAVKGECHHDCSYCYMKRWGKLNPVRLDVKEFKTDLGNGNYIFVGSSTDMFAENIPIQWIHDIQNHCKKFDNTYLFQTKDTSRIAKSETLNLFPEDTIICTTIETNRQYDGIMGNSPPVNDRVSGMELIEKYSDYKRFVTIEPIMDFDLTAFVELIKQCKPDQVSIGADSGRNDLPEPSEGKVIELIGALRSDGVNVFFKDNLKRLYDFKKDGE